MPNSQTSRKFGKKIIVITIEVTLVTTHAMVKSQGISADKFQDYKQNLIEKSTRGNTTMNMFLYTVVTEMFWKFR